MSREQESSDSESSGFVATHALSASNSRERDTWIVDSGATCHMCHDRAIFNIQLIGKLINCRFG